jgi:isoquinoline 1-oxidoreductase beta subunit
MRTDETGSRAGTLSRRTVLKAVALAGAGFVVGCGRRSARRGGEASFNAFVRIGSDDLVTVILKHLEMGQGIATGLATLVAEELDADWGSMRTEFAPVDAVRYANLAWGNLQGTGGSTSLANSWIQLRTAAAAARAMLTQAAAAEWQVAAPEIAISRGALAHISGRSARFGALAAKAAKLSPPATPTLKSPSEFRLIGTTLHRLDNVAKTTGTEIYTIDVKKPGLLTALVAHPPKFGAKLAAFDDKAARAIQGVVDVVQIETGIAVVARNFWAASRARDALTLTWDFTSAETRSTEDLRAELNRLADTEGLRARDAGDVDAAFGSAAKTIEAEFEFPYLAHTAMEPMNAVIELGHGKCILTTASQLPSLDQETVANILGLDPGDVEIEVRPAGGSFGRRAGIGRDFIAEAAMIARATKTHAPIKLQWTREDDLKAGRYRPMSLHRVRAGLDAEGNISAWSHRIVVQSILGATPFARTGFTAGVDQTAVEGARDLPYAISNTRVDWQMPLIGVPVSWWRGGGHTHNAFVVEAFLDEIAAAAGRDPIGYRQDLLIARPRHQMVLGLALERAGPAPSGAGLGRGVALHESFGTCVAQIAEVSVGTDGRFKVERVVCALDCGIAVNPDIIRAQMEGGIGFGLSAALGEEVTLQDGAVRQAGFADYPILRIDQMPEVEVHILRSDASPTGVGQAGVPPIAPAVANALYAATGKRLRRLPLGMRVAL